MFAQLIKHLKILSQARMYWLVIILSGLSLLAAALYSQHVLEELPCVVCIQIRLLISLMVMVAIAVVVHARLLGPVRKGRPATLFAYFFFTFQFPDVNGIFQPLARAPAHEHAQPKP